MHPLHILEPYKKILLDFLRVIFMINGRSLCCVTVHAQFCFYESFNGHMCGF